MLPIGPEVLLVLVLAAFVAGLIDSIAGGGGLLALPAILLAGAPPVTALATNKLQGMFGTASAALHFARAGQVDLATQIGPALLAAMAAGLHLPRAGVVERGGGGAEHALELVGGERRHGRGPGEEDGRKRQEAAAARDGVDGARDEGGEDEEEKDLGGDREHQANPSRA